VHFVFLPLPTHWQSRHWPLPGASQWVHFVEAGIVCMTQDTAKPRCANRKYDAERASTLQER